MKRVALVACLALLAGCSRGYKATPATLQIDAQEYDRVFRASVEVLRDYGFRVNRSDYRFGVVTTEPISSPTAFEPWINHNTTPTQAAGSTFDHLRRSATVLIEPVSPEEAAAVDAIAGAVEPAPAEASPEQPRPAAEPEAYRLRVEVVLENQQVPVRRLNGAVTGGRFSDLSAVPAEWQQRNIAPTYWQPVGRDAHLERRLARDIIERSLTLAEPRSAAR